LGAGAIARWIADTNPIGKEGSSAESAVTCPAKTFLAMSFGSSPRTGRWPESISKSSTPIA
jgi:hypothetical protein